MYRPSTHQHLNNENSKLPLTTKTFRSEDDYSYSMGEKSVDENT